MMGGEARCGLTGPKRRHRGLPALVFLRRYTAEALGLVLFQRYVNRVGPPQNTVRLSIVPAVGYDFPAVIDYLQAR